MNKGTHHSPESINRISLSLKGHLGWNAGKSLSLDTRRKLSEANKGKHHTIESRIKMSANSSVKGKHRNPETIAKISAAETGEKNHNYGKRASIETRAKMSATRKGRLVRAETLTKILASQRHKQTKPEKLVGAVLNDLFPNEYKYIGSDGSAMLNRCVPDFINVNGQKKVIEVFGNYWHSEQMTHRTKVQEEARKLSNYTEIGFNCLIVWENETKNINMLKQRISAFHSADVESDKGEDAQSAF